MLRQQKLVGLGRDECQGQSDSPHVNWLGNTVVTIQKCLLAPSRTGLFIWLTVYFLYLCQTSYLSSPVSCYTVTCLSYCNHLQLYKMGIEGRLWCWCLYRWIFYHHISEPHWCSCHDDIGNICSRSAASTSHLLDFCCLKHRYALRLLKQKH